MLYPSLTEKLNPVLLKLAISTGLLCVIFYLVPLAKVLAVMATVNTLWLLAGVFLQVMLRVVTALRMKMIAGAQGVNTGFKTMLRIVFTSTLYNLVAPGALAGGAVTYIKYRQHGVKPVAAVANIYANKFIEILVIALSAPLFWLIDKGFDLQLVVAYGLTMVTAFAFVFALFFGRFGNLQWLASGINRHGQSVIHRALAALCRQLGEIGQISHAAIMALVLSTAMYCLLAALAIVCFGQSLGFEIDLVTILWIYPVIYLLGVLPISISSLGVREAGMIMLLAPYGIASVEAIAWSVLMYSGPLSSGLIGLLLEAEFISANRKGGSTAESENCPVTEKKVPAGRRAQ